MTTPSFRGLSPASAISSRTKQANTCVGTRHEVTLRSLLWRRGLRFRKNVKSLPGKPDIVFSSARIIAFCDGDFWHGRRRRTLATKPRDGANAPYRLSKIQSNRGRDQRTNRALAQEAWTVIRGWEADIRTDAAAIANSIATRVRRSKGLR